jgi:maleylacetoacetate isomerase
MAASNNKTDNNFITLYSGAPSDCSSRLRIALNLKGISYDLKTLTGAFTPQTPSSLNPARTVPTLVIQDPLKGLLTLTQSVAALEYLEDAYPDDRPLLPKDPRGRAWVRTLVNIIATDIHPLTTHRVGAAIFDMFQSDATAEVRANVNRRWDFHWIERGIGVYEKMLEPTAGKYSVGDEVTLADVCLVPEMWTALARGLELEKYPYTAGVFGRLMQLPEFGKERTH